MFQCRRALYFFSKQCRWEHHSFLKKKKLVTVCYSTALFMLVCILLFKNKMKEKNWNTPPWSDSGGLPWFGIWCWLLLDGLCFKGNATLWWMLPLCTFRYWCHTRWSHWDHQKSHVCRPASWQSFCAWSAGHGTGGRYKHLSGSPCLCWKVS